MSHFVGKRRPNRLIPRVQSKKSNSSTADAVSGSADSTPSVAMESHQYSR